MGNEKNPLVKTDWLANFTLIGKPKLNDFTFKIDQHSEKSDWIYNSMNIGIDCGPEHGTVYAELMGGYASERENKIYAHGKKENGADDYSMKMEIAWDDRDDESILEQIGDRCFVTVGLEKTDKGKTYYKKFLSAYDAIAYVQECLTDDMVVNVKGNLQYSTYNDKTQIRKTITSIVLSSVDDPANYQARFTQSVLIDKDSASLKDVDKDKGVMYVNTYVLDYLKEYNGVDVKGNFPYPVQFEFAMDFTKPEQCKKIVDKLFKVKKGITQITFEGEFIESGATVTTTMDDVPQEVKELVDMGLYTEEDALASCSTNGNRERRMVLKKPFIKKVGDEEKVPVVQIFPEKFTEDDLILDCMLGKNDDMYDDTIEVAEIKSDDDSMAWLDDLE